MPDSQPDANSLFDGSDLGATTIANAVEAPTSDVRDEAGPEVAAQPAVPAETQSSTESTQQVPETQLERMDTEEDVKPTETQGVSGAAAQVPPTSQDSNGAPTDTAPTKPMTELTLQTQQSAASTSQLATQSPANIDQEMEDAPSSGKVRAREEDDEDEDELRDVKRPKTEETGGEAEFKVPEIPVHTEQTNGDGITVAPHTPISDSNPVQSAVGAEDWPTTPMTPAQSKFLLERVRNTKKIKVASAFKEPVDWNALNLPTYPQVVTSPMDLTTMENKLKDGQYQLIREFMVDLDLIISNSVAFNTKDHPVTQAGYNMRAYFLKGMGKMPKAGVEEPPKPVKPKKPVVATTTKPRREPRAAAAATAKSPTVPTPTTAASPQAAWPLNADGLPLIRRDSSSANDRPKREIHRPPPKDLPYNTAKPKKRKYQQELKFCESVLTEIVKAKYSKFAYPFLVPVDPVALNIPSYLKIIKKPMDFGTVEKNLKSGQYQTAKDFYNDAQLVFQNCYKFNPETDEVHKMGKQLNELFDELWKEKSEWLAQHAPTSDPQSPGSAYSDEEEEEEEVDPAQAQILAIQKQIQQLNETAQTLLQQQQGKRTSPKAPGKKKAGKPPAPKKKNSLAVPPPPKPAKAKQRTRAPAPLSFAQKQEISDGISTLGDAEMRKAVQIIRNGCPHLANVNDDEMEIDMDEIGDETLRELFKFIKQVRGPKGAIIEDDDFEPPRPTHKATATKPKKNKPMGKKEQEDSIKRIEAQLQNFQENGSGSSQSPAGEWHANSRRFSETDLSEAAQDDSSDDESSGSESEEE
jgi:bromodomain-containing factor 1